MISLMKNVRVWWQVPRSTSERENERRVTFLELFYDLVYVVVISEIAHGLTVDVSWGGLGRYFFLFVTVWWAWVNGTVYHDLHGNNDIRTRVFTFLQMFTVAAMAIFVHSVWGEGSIGFALALAAYQLILTFLWWRTGVHDPSHRPASRIYSAVFLIGTALIAGSVLVAPPIRYYMWGVALMMELLLPVWLLQLNPPERQMQTDSGESIWITESIVERFGLLTIIVLGEVIVGVVRGVSVHHDLTLMVILTAGLGMLIAVGVWWIYFDFLSHHGPRTERRATGTWMYLHLFVTAGIVAIGSAVMNVVEHVGEPLAPGVVWLLVGSVAFVLISMALLMRVMDMPDVVLPAYRRGSMLMLAAAAGALLLGLLGVPTILLLVGLNLLILVPVVYAVVVWVAQFGGGSVLMD